MQLNVDSIRRTGDIMSYSVQLKSRAATEARQKKRTCSLNQILLRRLVRSG